VLFNGVVAPANATFPQRLEVKSPLWFKQVFYRSLALMGLRPNAFGGFGALIPVASAGGGYG